MLSDIYAEGAEFLPEFRGAAVEDYAGHAGAFGAFDVHGGVVDEQAFFRLQGEFLEEAFIDAALGFYELLVGGDECAVKILAAGDAVPVLVLAIARVGEQIDAAARRFEVADNVGHAGHGVDGSVPAVNEAVYLVVQLGGDTGAHDLRGLRVRQGAAVHFRPFEGEIDIVHEDAALLPFRADGIEEAVEVPTRTLRENTFHHNCILRSYPLTDFIITCCTLDAINYCFAVTLIIAFATATASSTVL